MTAAIDDRLCSFSAAVVGMEGEAFVIRDRVLDTHATFGGDVTEGTIAFVDAQARAAVAGDRSVASLTGAGPCDAPGPTLCRCEPYPAR